EFRAHEVGHANRSARVERPFDYIDNNFNAGRHATDWRDLNRQALEWCEKTNATYRRHLRASPRELFAQERLHLVPLPDWIPEVVQLHHRIVGVDGYVTVHTNLYPVPDEIPTGRQVQVRETKSHVEIYVGPRRVAQHDRVLEACGKRVPGPERRSRQRRSKISAEEQELLDLAPELAGYVAQLKTRGKGSTTLALRRLLHMVRDYPREPLCAALRQAEHYGLYELERVERMVLKQIAGDYFLLSEGTVDGPEVPHD
ncbi:MAG: hypothetical protein KC766_39950, partial [Myxococcales bacterium]|nr:hypothetical protein [Myxococcales bacterium]